MRPHVYDASVGGDGKDVGGPVESAHGNPPAVGTEADVLHLEREKWSVVFFL